MFRHQKCSALNFCSPGLAVEYPARPIESMKHIATVFCALLVAWAAVAVISPSRRTMDAGSAPAGYNEAEVRKVDGKNKQIWLSHTGVDHLGLPPMTTMFDVRDGVALDKVQPGDRVQFKAINDKRTLLIVEMRLSR